MTGPVSSTVGIVLLSHSRDLAEGLRGLLTQLGGVGSSVSIAGGTSDGRLGTSPDLLADAVARVSAGAGVLVIADIGSAVLTARAWLADYSGPERVVLADTPFVEGAVAAAVTASTGADLDTVIAAAHGAWSVRKL